MGYAVQILESSWFSEYRPGHSSLACLAGVGCASAQPFVLLALAYTIALLLISM